MENGKTGKRENGKISNAIRNNPRAEETSQERQDLLPGNESDHQDELSGVPGILLPALPALLNWELQLQAELRLPPVRGHTR